MTLLYEGKTKQLFSTDNENEILIKFKDSYCPVAAEREVIFKKEKLASDFNKHYFFILDSLIQNHIIKYNDDNSFIAKKCEIIPLKIVIRNFSAGSICLRKGYKKGEWFPYPLIEYFLKTGEEQLPEVTEAQIVQSGMMNYDAIDKIIELTTLVNKLLRESIIKKDLLLIDVELEFGVDSGGNILLVDEVSPYTMRISSQDTKLYWDKDAFKAKCSEEVIESYKELAKILGV